MAVDVSLWRLAKDTPKYRADDLSGGGAAAFGGRWNSKGNHVVYTSQTIALASLESLAHIGSDIHARNRFLVEVSVPIGVWKNRQTITPGGLPATWVAEPPGTGTTDFGDSWIAGNTSALLLVPSVIIHEEFNVLINPAHPDARKIRARVIRPYVFDPRFK